MSYKYNGKTFPNATTDGDIELDYTSMKMYINKAEQERDELRKKLEAIPILLRAQADGIEKELNK